MIETESLILDKAKFSDWKDMYVHVWSQPECAKFMLWNVTTNEADAKIRITKTIAFQKEHDTYLVYEKASGKAIGFAGVEACRPYVYQEAGICLGVNYMRKGYGKQILRGLIRYCKEAYAAKEFRYLTRVENEASIRLAESLGFSMLSSFVKTEAKDQLAHRYLQYHIDVSSFYD